jgi:hypothetical protein
MVYTIPGAGVGARGLNLKPAAIRLRCLVSHRQDPGNASSRFAPVIGLWHTAFVRQGSTQLAGPGIATAVVLVLLTGFAKAAVIVDDGQRREVSTAGFADFNVYNRDRSASGDPSTLAVVSGGFVDSVFVTQSSTVSLEGGWARSVRLLKSASASISDGTLSSSLDAFDDASVHVSGGIHSADFTVRDNASIRITDGNFGGNFGSSLAASSDDGFSSRVDVSGGTFVGNLFAGNSDSTSGESRIFISGGVHDLDLLQVTSGGSIIISGGAFSSLGSETTFVSGLRANVTLAGSGFSINSVPVAPGTTLGSASGSGSTVYQVDAVLADGSLFSGEFSLLNGGELVLVTAVPEPGSLAAGMLLLALTARRRRS